MKEQSKKPQTGNFLLDRFLAIVPDDPLQQAKYMYYLSSIVFIGILGYTVVSWAGLLAVFEPKGLFQSIFMSAICLITLFGLKQARTSYHTTKSYFENMEQQKKEPLPSVKDMMASFSK